MIQAEKAVTNILGTPVLHQVFDFVIILMARYLVKAKRCSGGIWSLRRKADNQAHFLTK